jgi:sulfur carrier protein
VEVAVIIVINGEAREVPSGTTVAQVVATLTGQPSGIAVAVNSEVVPRGGWAGQVLGERDRVEVVTAVQGG